MENNNKEVPRDVFNQLLVNWSKMSKADRIEAINKIMAEYGETERYKILCRMLNDLVEITDIPVVHIDSLGSFLNKKLSKEEAAAAITKEEWEEATKHIKFELNGNEFYPDKKTKRNNNKPRI